MYIHREREHLKNGRLHYRNIVCVHATKYYSLPKCNGY